MKYRRKGTHSVWCSEPAPHLSAPQLTEYGVWGLLIKLSEPNWEKEMTVPAWKDEEKVDMKTSGAEPGIRWVLSVSPLPLSNFCKASRWTGPGRQSVSKSGSGVADEGTPCMDEYLPYSEHMVDPWQQELGPSVIPISCLVPFHARSCGLLEKDWVQSPCPATKVRGVLAGHFPSLSFSST